MKPRKKEMLVKWKKKCTIEELSTERKKEKERELGTNKKIWKIQRGTRNIKR